MGNRHNIKQDEVYEIKEFYEKPNEARAREFIRKIFYGIVEFLYLKPIFSLNY